MSFSQQSSSNKRNKCSTPSSTLLNSIQHPWSRDYILIVLKGILFLYGIILYGNKTFYNVCFGVFFLSFWMVLKPKQEQERDTFCLLLFMFCRHLLFKKKKKKTEPNQFDIVLLPPGGSDGKQQVCTRFCLYLMPLLPFYFQLTATNAS